MRRQTSRPSSLRSRRSQRCAYRPAAPLSRMEPRAEHLSVRASELSYLSAGILHFCRVVSPRRHRGRLGGSNQCPLYTLLNLLVLPSPGITAVASLPHNLLYDGVATSSGIQPPRIYQVFYPALRVSCTNFHSS